MKCDNSRCLQEPPSAGLAHLPGQVLHEAWLAIANAAARRQRYLDLRTKAVNFALAQRVCCRNLLARDTSDDSHEESGNAQ